MKLNLVIINMQSQICSKVRSFIVLNFLRSYTILVKTY